MPRYQKPGPMDAAQQKINRAMVDGVGGLRFVAQAPPGVGRLVRIPFYAETAVARFVALNAQASGVSQDGGTGYAAGVASTTHPVIHFDPNATGETGTLLLKTPQISWALLRIVGFEVNMLYVPAPTEAQAELSFADLKIGGGASLFVHEDYAPAGIYLMGQDSFAGLRDYPLMKSPNQAEVGVRGLAHTSSAGVSFSCNLVCEIVTDDNYGSHVPGPYARPGALVRQGGGFVQG